MSKSRLDLPHIKLLIAHKIAGGYSQREIAKELKTSQPTICRMVKRKDVIDSINEIENKLLRQVDETFKKLENDSEFQAELQERLLKEIFNFDGLL
jgi:DNA-binding MarR family transcriptional regulator